MGFVDGLGPWSGRVENSKNNGSSSSSTVVVGDMTAL